MVGYRLRSVLLDEPTAIVHDWFQGMHGSERVVDTIRSGLFGRDRAPDILTFVAARDVLPAELRARKDSRTSDSHTRDSRTRDSRTSDSRTSDGDER